MSNVEILQQNGYNFLWIDNYLWMWDIPVERKVQEKIAGQAYGDVLVAGYGLGIVQRYLMKNTKVNSVMTIEKESDVIDKCKGVYGDIYGDIRIIDFFSYETDKKFDCVIGDVCEDIMEEAAEDYKKFIDKATTLLRKDGIILAWGKEFFEYLIEREDLK